MGTSGDTDTWVHIYVPPDVPIEGNVGGHVDMHPGVGVPAQDGLHQGL